MSELEDIINHDAESKYLIFTTFSDTQDYISESLEDNGIQVAKFNGQMSTKQRDNAVSKFKRDINEYKKDRHIVERQSQNNVLNRLQSFS